jgi:GntR family transcriptional regulator
VEDAAQRVLSYIQEENLAAGDRLPAEVILAQKLKLSRNSVREAYVSLIAKGVIRRKHGIGTFVANPPLLNSLGGSVGFWSLIEQAGLKPSLRELARGKVQPPQDIADLLGLAPRVPSPRMRWLFLASETPCILIDHYPAVGIPLDIFDPVNGPNAVPPLRDRIVVEGATLATRTTAVNASAEIAGLLEVEEGQALLSGTSVINGGDGRAALASRSWMVPQLLNSQQVMSLTASHFLNTADPTPKEQTS